ncbi:endonuclease precursor-like precursor [Capsicum annuum]|uniref:Uncharacterized protein n=1 Tax=Capsicum annuum TaxID=4072 RepID=A0A2G3AJ65_CAPAN|nr:endonuclease precursor-like precursor [Capsicum annuum]KAF3644610.1 endonuclease precursor-like precursor [Capsicum annuum]PHT94285.1 hypothetical protein T459_02167 [Capsicum annuum]
MEKSLKLRFSKVIASFNSCCFKDPSSLPQNPNFYPSLHITNNTKLSKWQKEEKFHVISNSFISEDEEEEECEEEIHLALKPPTTPPRFSTHYVKKKEKKKRRFKKTKMRIFADSVPCDIDIGKSEFCFFCERLNLGISTTETKTLSQNQERRIDELEAQLNEAEGLIIDLRAELNDVHEKLNEMKNKPPHNLRPHVEEDLTRVDKSGSQKTEAMFFVGKASVKSRLRGRLS